MFASETDRQQLAIKRYCNFLTVTGNSRCTFLCRTQLTENERGGQQLMAVISVFCICKKLAKMDNDQFFFHSLPEKLKPETFLGLVPTMI